MKLLHVLGWCLAAPVIFVASITFVLVVMLLALHVINFVAPYLSWLVPR